MKPLLFLLFPFLTLQDPTQDKPAIPPDKDPVTTASGLKYTVIAAGTGESPKPGDKVKVNYTGWLMDGTVFDASAKHGGPAEFQIGGVIEGWNEGLALMKRGAKYKFTIPPQLGYGKGGSPPVIPADATLIFLVELLDFSSPPKPWGEAQTFRKIKADAQKSTASGLKYEVVKAGEGKPAANDKDTLEFNYAVWNDDGKMLDGSMTGRPAKARGSDVNLPPLKEALLLMPAGSHYLLEIDAEAGDPTQGKQQRPKTVWQLELVSIKEAPKPLKVPDFVKPAADKLKTTASGLKYEVVKEGEGASPKMGEMVSAHYAGWLEDGTMFDNSFERGEPLSIPLGRVIPGWNEGLQLMKVGSIYRFVIKPELGYGPQRQDKIPANSTLIFYVELLDVTK